MNVVVVGAGYAGTVAANRLSRRVPDARITVVNPRSDFVERVRLHEQIAGTGGAATPLTEMLRRGVAHRVAVVTAIGDGTITLEDGCVIQCDYVILAVGSTVAPMGGTVPVGTWEGAREARARLDALPAKSIATVIGGGLTGVETAAEIAAARRDLTVRLVAPTLVPSLSPGARTRVRRGLERLGVAVVADTVDLVEGADVVKMAGMRARTPPPAVLRLRSGEELSSDVILWAIVSGVPDLARRSGLEVDDEGRVVVDEFLRSVSADRVFAVGDCAAVPGARPSCATATPQGAHAADTLARIIGGHAPRRHSFGYVGQAVSLGRHDGVIQASRRDGTLRRIFISGRVAAITKERITRYAKYGSRTATYYWLPGRR